MATLDQPAWFPWVGWRGSGRLSAVGRSAVRCRRLAPRRRTQLCQRCGGGCCARLACRTRNDGRMDAAFGTDSYNYQWQLYQEILAKAGKDLASSCGAASVTTQANWRSC